MTEAYWKAVADKCRIIPHKTFLKSLHVSCLPGENFPHAFSHFWHYLHGQTTAGVYVFLKMQLTEPRKRIIFSPPCFHCFAWSTLAFSEMLKHPQLLCSVLYEHYTDSFRRMFVSCTFEHRLQRPSPRQRVDGSWYLRFVFTSLAIYLHWNESYRNDNHKNYDNFNPQHRQNKSHHIQSKTAEISMRRKNKAH